ncbi:hypothetical protein EJB05_25062, partial [Eragrostis curvula]
MKFFMRLSSISGAGSDDDGDGYGVFGGPAMDGCVTIVMFFVLAASVVIWEACAFAAMAALLVGAIWCLLPKRRASTYVLAAAPASVVGDGLTDADIDDALPASPHERRRVVTCSVCLEDVRGGEMVRSLPECRHLFHVRCIDVWLHLHATCPLCRSDLSPRRRGTAARLPPQLPLV